MAIVITTADPAAGGTLEWEPNDPITAQIDSDDSGVGGELHLSSLRVDLGTSLGDAVTNGVVQTGWEDNSTVTLTNNGTGADHRILLSIVPNGGWLRSRLYGAETPASYPAPQSGWTWESPSGGAIVEVASDETSLSDDPWHGFATLAEALAITTTTLPAVAVNTAYSQTVAATGGYVPYTWSISAGALPPGLSINASTGAITGTPTTPGTYTFTVQVTDSYAGTDTQALAIVVTSPWTYEALSATEVALAAADVPMFVAPNALVSPVRDAEWRTGLTWRVGSDSTASDAVLRWSAARVYDGLGDPPTLSSAAMPNAMVFELADGLGVGDAVAIVGHNLDEVAPTAVTLQVASDDGYSFNLQSIARWTTGFGQRLVETQLGVGLHTGVVSGARYTTRYLRLLIEGGSTTAVRIGEIWFGRRHTPSHRQEYEADEQALSSRVDVAEAEDGTQQRIARWTGRLDTVLRWRPDSAAYVAVFRGLLEATRWGADPMLYIPRPSSAETECYLVRTTPDVDVPNLEAGLYEIELPLIEQSPYVSKES